jgi:hypothetical protein
LQGELILKSGSSVALNEVEMAEVFRYIDDFIDGLRMEVVIFDHSREIVSVTESRVTVSDKDLVLDESKDYEAFLLHPSCKNRFIPCALDLYETQIVLEIDRRGGFRVVDLKDVGVTGYESITLDDPRVSDACLVQLIKRMGFDSDSQRYSPELVASINEVLRSNDLKTEGLRSRFKPHLWETD